MKKLIFFLTLLSCMGLVTAQNTLQKHWTPDINTYPYTMTMTSYVVIDGVEIENQDIEVALFEGNMCLTAERALYYDNEQFSHHYFWFLYPHGVDDITMTFRVWNHATNSEMEVTSDPATVTFVTNGSLGTMENPFRISFTTKRNYTFVNNGDWNNKNNWLDNSGQTPSTMPDLTNEDVVINAKAIIPKGYAASVKSLTINDGGSVTVNKNASLSVSGEINKNNDPSGLVLNDGGQIFQTNTGVTATFRKAITNPTDWEHSKDGWQFISSPIINTTIESFTSQDTDYDLYIWDGGFEDYPWRNYKNPDNVSNYDDYFVQYLNCENEYGYGYLASYKNTTTAVFTGELRTLDAEGFDFTVNGKNGGEWENLNLIGNPFPFDIQSSDLDRTKISTGFAIIDPETNSIVYQNNEGIIKAGQGFFVLATAKNPRLSYPNSSKEDKGEARYIDITVEGRSGHDNVILDFSGSENEGFIKCMPANDDIATVFTKSDSKMYGISCYDDDTEEITLCFDAKEAGSYTMKIKTKGDFNHIHLLDKMTGEDIDMLVEDEYRFKAMSNDNISRFIIRLSDKGEDNGSQFAYQSGKQLFIIGSGKVQVIDMMGRVVLNTTADGSPLDISNLKEAAYIVRLSGENNVKTQKIVLL